MLDRPDAPAAERSGVPPDGAPANLIREAGAGIVVAPHDVAGMTAALRDLHTAWKAGTLDGTPLTEEWRRRVSRRTRSEELARLLEQVVG